MATAPADRRHVLGHLGNPLPAEGRILGQPAVAAQIEGSRRNAEGIEESEVGRKAPGAVMGAMNEQQHGTVRAAPCSASQGAAQMQPPLPGALPRKRIEIAEIQRIDGLKGQCFLSRREGPDLTHVGRLM